MKTAPPKKIFKGSFSSDKPNKLFSTKQASLSSVVFEKILLLMSGGCPPAEETRKETNNAVDDDDTDDDDDKGDSTCEFRVACVQFEPAHGAFNFYHRFKNFSTNCFYR